MVVPARNEPCHCGSGKKYKKCCLCKDDAQATARREQEVQDAAYERQVRAGNIDPFGGEGFWEEEPEEEPEEELEEEPEEESVPDFIEGQDEEDPALELPPEGEFTAGEQAAVDAWWATYKELSDPDDRKDHLDAFLTSHPQLIATLGVEDPLFAIQSQYLRADRHADFIALLSRLRREVPDAYAQTFGYWGRDMIAWLVSQDRRAETAEYLGDFRASPDGDPDNLFAVIHFLMSWNCRSVLADFVPAVFRKVCTSPRILGGEEILIPMAMLVMAPFLDRGLDGCDPSALADALRTLGPKLNPKWTDPGFLQKRLHLILGPPRPWNLDGCRTRSDAISRYNDATSNFLGWLAARKSLDWCAAEHHRELVFTYLGKALPEERRPREPFPFAEKDMDRLLLVLSRKMFAPDSTRLFGLLNGIYWFLEFLEETGSLEPELARERREACAYIYRRVYPGQRQSDFLAVAWQQFPR